MDLPKEPFFIIIPIPFIDSTILAHVGLIREADQRSAHTPKRAIATSRPAFTLDASLPVPLYKQLYARLHSAILEGQLERGARLPSTRTLASELGVSRTTTALA